MSKNHGSKPKRKSSVEDKDRGKRQALPKKKVLGAAPLRWIECEECGDWIIFENSGLICDFGEVDKGAVSFVCKFCRLEVQFDGLSDEYEALQVKSLKQ